MDWSKVDATLAAALADAGADDSCRLPVFVHLDADAADPSFLDELPLAPPGERGICTGTLSAADVDRLTEQPWVRSIGLSGPLRLLGTD